MPRPPQRLARPAVLPRSLYWREPNAKRWRTPLRRERARWRSRRCPARPPSRSRFSIAREAFSRWWANEARAAVDPWRHRRSRRARTRRDRSLWRCFTSNDFACRPDRAAGAAARSNPHRRLWRPRRPQRVPHRTWHRPGDRRDTSFCGADFGRCAARLRTGRSTPVDDRAASLAPPSARPLDRGGQHESGGGACRSGGAAPLAHGRRRRARVLQRCAGGAVSGPPRRSTAPATAIARLRSGSGARALWARGGAPSFRALCHRCPRLQGERRRRHRGKDHRGARARPTGDHRSPAASRAGRSGRNGGGGSPMACSSSAVRSSKEGVMNPRPNLVFVFAALAVFAAIGSSAPYAQINPFSQYYDNVARAARQNDIATVRSLMADNSNNPNQADENGRTALHYGAMNGNLTIIAIMVKAKA